MLASRNESSRAEHPLGAAVVAKDRVSHLIVDGYNGVRLSPVAWTTRYVVNFLEYSD